LNICTLAALDQLDSEDPEFLFHKRDKYVHYKRAKRLQEDTADRIERSQRESREAKAAAETKRSLAATQSHENLLSNLSQPKFRALYIAIARLFVERLIKDVNVLHELEALPPGPDRASLVRQLSLAAKWAPTPHASHDRHTNLSTAIGLLLYHSQSAMAIKFPSSLSASPGPAEVHILRSFYQRWVLTPLRKTIMIPEPLMSANHWNKIKYDHVSSICMKDNTVNFFQHDPERFEKYLGDVKSGKKTISGATLYPHQLVAQVVSVSNPSKGPKAKLKIATKLAEMQIQVIEAQWKTLVGRLRESGKLENSIAICDVSGSMGDIDSKKTHPILPAVALSLVLAQLASPPFDNGFITFSANPQFVQLDPSKGLAQSISDLRSADWGMNTDLDAVFLKLLLPLAIKNKVKPEDMIKRLFIFSDMQFDQGRSSAKQADWETCHDVYEKEFKAAGYELPQIVYWDLANGGTVQATADRKGVAMMNGFSPSLLKVFMGEEEEKEKENWEDVSKDGESMTVEVDVKEEFTPLNVMKKALLVGSFDGLVVID
jgi:Domain of unknown function (DUF2828)